MQYWPVPCRIRATSVRRMFIRRHALFYVRSTSITGPNKHIRATYSTAAACVKDGKVTPLVTWRLPHPHRV